MIQKKRNNILIILLLLSGFAEAQQFHYTASLEDVKKDGFYSIPVSAELSSYLKTDLSDIRVADEKGQWIPHLIIWPLKNAVIEPVLWHLPIVKKEKNETTTVLVINNTGKQNINNLIINLKNSSANRKAVISGSDEQQNWFTITDSIQLIPETENNKPALKISFPLVNYNYFKVTILNGKNDPYNILDVETAGPGDPMYKTERMKFITNPGTQFSQKDTTGFSLIKVENSARFHFNRIKLIISSPHFYNRRAKLYSRYNGESLNSLFYSSPGEEYIISSGNNSDYETDWRKDSLFYLLIENQDNPPLKIERIVTIQTSKTLVAYLEKGKQYKLLFNDPAASAPAYDLQKFRDRIPDSTDVLAVGKITAVSKSVSIDKAPAQNTWQRWMWPVIILVLLLLGYFTFSLARDVKNKKGNDRL